MKKDNSTWIQGYACAIAMIVAVDGPCTRTDEALCNAGLNSMAALRKTNIDESDIEHLRPSIEGIQRNKRYDRARALKTLKRKEGL